MADIAVVGLAVMGQNLILNMADHGFKVVAFNRTVSKVTEFLAGPAAGTSIVGATSYENVVSQLKSPRVVMLMIQAGSAVDGAIDSLLPLLGRGDVIVDGGNSHFPDTQRRCERCAEAGGVLFVGCGVSGGEDGARYGPSLMPGGAAEAWPIIAPIFQAIAAKSGTDPCCEWVGAGGSGHYVKMVHNGVEYGDMQLICEAYHLLKDWLGMDHAEMSAVFAEWNRGELDSFLIEITRDILAFRDEADGAPLVTKILDSAGQKGTGKWTAISGLDCGIPVTLVGEAVFARCLSALKPQRVAASTRLSGPKPPAFTGDRAAMVEKIRLALYASKIVSYTQGYMLLAAASAEYKWSLNFGGIALMWRGGCIIRSVFLGDIKAAFERDASLSNLLFDDFFASAVARCQDAWREVVAAGVTIGVPLPTFSAALAFYDGFRSAWLPASLLQAQRDYFGAHQYRRLDDPTKELHTNWTGHGGAVASSSYTV